MCIKNGIKLILGFYFVTVFWGCAASKPNTPYPGPYPSGFHELAYKNPLLAKELGKLPELQDGISVNENYALVKLINLYDENPNAFHKVFEEMYLIGLPDVRKYCSPLQALFWLAEDGKLDDMKDILKDYSLQKLLDTAWDFQVKPIQFSEEQISMIIDNTKDKKMQEQFFRHKNDKKYIQTLISINYDYKPGIFKRKAIMIIKKVKSENEDMRWKDFNIVTDRLSSPELLDYYERHVISYKYIRGYGEGPEEAGRVFKNKYGHCAQITAFTLYVLQKGGYEARRYIVADRALMSSKGNYHRACLFIVNGEKYIMDNGRTFPKGIVRFEDYGSSEDRKKSEQLQGEPILYTP